MRIGNRISPVLFFVLLLSACSEASNNDTQRQIIPESFSVLEESGEETDENKTEVIDNNITDFDAPTGEPERKEYEKGIINDSKYDEMDIKQFLIDNYNFLEEDIDPNYDLVAFMRDYRFDERNYSEELVKAAYEENKYYYLPTEKGYISWFLSDNESTPITQEDKFIKVGYSWGEDLSINENVLYDLEKDLVYSDGKEPSELSESKLEVVSGIVKQYCIDKWELCQVYEGDSEACDGWSGWKMVFELEDGSKRAYSGSCGPGEEIPSEWKSLRNTLLVW